MSNNDGNVVVEANIPLQLGSSRRDREGIGVLVGRLTSKNSFVLLFVPTPALESSLENSEKNSFPSEEWWVEDHAHQVWDLLPGGVSVVGLCLISPSLGKHVATALYKLTHSLCKPRESLPASLLPCRLLIMHFSTLTNRLTCQQLDPQNTTVCALPVDVITRRLTDSWWCLESTVPVQLETLVPVLPGDSFLGVHELITSFDLWRLGIVVFGDQYSRSDERLANCKQGRCVRCTVYPKRKALECGQSQLVDNAATMAVDGSVALLAYVPLDATFADAAEAVTGDMVQTVAVRWKRMCEDLHYQQLLSGTWHLPQRVQLSVKGWMFHLCAYRFPDETEEVMCERVCEVVGVDVDSVRVICCEDGMRVTSRSLTRTAHSASLSLWVVIAAGLVALTAILIFFSTNRLLQH